MYCFYGQDDYSIKTEVDSLIKNYGTVNYIWEKEQLDNVIDISSQGSLFGEESMIVIRDLLKSIDIEILKKLADTPIVFWEGEKLDKRLSSVKWLQKNAEVVEFKPKQRQEVYAWVRDSGYTVDYKLLQIMWDRYESNLWAWHNELEKISTFLQGSKQISVETVDVMGARTTEDNIFSFVDAFGERKKIVSISMFDDLLSQDVDPFYLHSMLARQVRLLLLASEPNGLSGNPPFVVKKIQAQFREWDFDHLLDAHGDLVAIDIAVKSGNADITNELASFLLTA